MTIKALDTRLTASEVARVLGVTRQAILKAEREGRIAPAEREIGGDDRLYKPDQVARIRAYFGR